MYKGRVYDDTYCYNLVKNVFLHANEVPFSILIGITLEQWKQQQQQQQALLPR